MKKTVSRVSSVVAALAALVWLATPAAAQVERMKVDVPFKFLAGETVLPAGTYVVELRETGRTMTLYGETKAIWVATTGAEVRRADNGRGNGALWFERVGNLYILRKVFNPNRTVGCELFRSKVERELASNSTGATIIAWAR